MLADSHALFAADASIGMLNIDVAMNEKLNLADDLTRAGFDALPTGLAMARVDGDKLGL